LIEISEKELHHFIEKKRVKDLRVKKYFLVLFVSVASSYALYYLGANIWHIIISVIGIETVFIIADMQPKIDEEKDAMYEAEFIKKKEYQHRKRQRKEARKKDSAKYATISKNQENKMAQVPEDIGCNNKECIAKDECKRFKIAKENSAREVQTFSGTEVKKCGKFLQS
jgi:hypothetical protein